MRILFFTMLLACLSLLCSAQNNQVPDAKVRPVDPEKSLKSVEKKTTPNNNSTQVHAFSTLEQNQIVHRAELKKKQAEEENIYRKYLGLTPNEPGYAAKKEFLHTNDPQSYQAMMKDLEALRGNKSSIHRLSRAKYNSLSPADKKKVDDNPSLYSIID